MRIGDFDSTWENYDRNAGPALIEEAQEQIKVGDSRPNWRLVVGGVDLTRRLISCEVNFNATDGSSGMRFTVAHQLYKQQMERARTSLWIGYGTKLVPFFRGKLAKPKDSPSGLYSEAEAFGLGTQMGQRYFGKRVDYTGFDMRDAWWDLIGKFGADPDRFFFDGEADRPLQTEGDETSLVEFGMEHSLLEAEQAIVSTMGHVAFDEIGGMHVVRKPPRADAVTRQNLDGGVWDDSMCPAEGFEFSDNSRNHYSEVVVFRRTEEYAGGGGTTGEGLGDIPPDEPTPEEYAVYASAQVTNSGPFNVHQGRRYIIPDFPGQQEHAERTAQWWADAFSAGVGRHTTEISPCDLGLYSYFGRERIEERRSAEFYGAFGRANYTALGDRYAVLYGCQVEEINLTIAQSTFRMSTSGACVVLEEELVEAGGSLVEIPLAFPPTDSSTPEPEPEGGESVGVDATADDVLVGTDTVVSGASD